MQKVIEVKWKPAVFQQIKQQVKRNEIPEKIGISAIFLDKLATGEKKISIKRMEELCRIFNLQPNDFFEITIKNG